MVDAAWRRRRALEVSVVVVAALSRRHRRTLGKSAASVESGALEHRRLGFWEGEGGEPHRHRPPLRSRCL